MIGTVYAMYSFYRQLFKSGGDGSFCFLFIVFLTAFTKKNHIKQIWEYPLYNSVWRFCGLTHGSAPTYNVLVFKRTGRRGNRPYEYSTRLSKIKSSIQSII